MSKKLDEARNLTYLDVLSGVQGAMKLEELTLSEGLPSPYPCQTITRESNAQNDSLAGARLEEVVVEQLVSPPTAENKSETADDEENSSVLMSSKTSTPEEMTEFVFPPELYRMTEGKKDQYGSLTLLKPKKKKTDYDSDDTCDEYVECGEKGLCKCQKMRGREYYTYYEETKEKEHYTMYPKGRCELPRGATLHFAGAPQNMKREDLREALVALGAKIEFLDYQKGSKEGCVRLSFPYEARIIIKKMRDKKLDVLGAELTFKVLSGKEEKRYHKKIIEAIYQLQEKSKGLNKKLTKAGYQYVKNINPDND